MKQQKKPVQQNKTVEPKKPKMPTQKDYLAALGPCGK